MTQNEAAPPQFDIIDAHVHMYPRNEQSMLAWYSPDGALAGRKSVVEYLEATTPTAPGFMLVEADRINSGGMHWDAPLAELKWAGRIATGTSHEKDEEGILSDFAQNLVGVIIWAPVHLGPTKLIEYLTLANKSVTPQVWAAVRGVRFLLQDKPDGTCCDPLFIDSLRELGRLGLAFDICVDHHRRGNAQLDDVLKMVQNVHGNVAPEQKAVFVIDHLCKPDLTISPSDPAFLDWKTAIIKLSSFSDVFVKLSGCFSEMNENMKLMPVKELSETIFPWISVVLEAFGARRIMFGSDWPVCTIGLENSWRKWHEVADLIFSKAELCEDDRKSIWATTAKIAYRL
ncbi:hypothetical protein HDU82_007950 [Entophlyctis luteolus]|nr:hypothetical protein HDU82_007950 [Entophlyctis luteolus]